ncbi:hypothetical protein [Streptomyces sp. NPDC052107]|uniref:hypothetical protein n=1 Tax=Streptomyces sp. NPDC052107 TaxID=3155632 RepID=UPI0034192F60
MTIQDGRDRNASGHEREEEAPGPQEGRADAPQTRTHVSTAGLRARGWTPGMVRQLLGEPDLLRRNPHFASAPRTRLCRLDRVETAERSEEFRAVSAAAASRSAAARAAFRRRREVLARIAAEPIDVPRLPARRLTEPAVEHRDRRDTERTYERRRHAPDPAAAPAADPHALDRWKVDHLRHRLTRYDELLGGLRGSTGRAAAEELLRRRLCAAVAEAYPDLAQECERQLGERESGPPGRMTGQDGAPAARGPPARPSLRSRHTKDDQVLPVHERLTASPPLLAGHLRAESSRHRRRRHLADGSG